MPAQRLEVRCGGAIRLGPEVLVIESDRPAGIPHPGTTQVGFRASIWRLCPIAGRRLVVVTPMGPPSSSVMVTRHSE